ncbi:MAG: AVAST type 3 anti-phage protein Avs3b [Pseudomonadota bacterium]
MESLERLSAVIDLGKRLVTQLKLGNDESAQWMAHALAERIKDAENAPPEKRVAAQSSCTELILQLWERRYSLPTQLRPLRSLEPLLRTLNSLDTRNGPRFRFMQERPAEVKLDETVEKTLDLAVKLDEAARILVQYFLATAAEQASEETKPWIQSAVDAGADVTLEVRVVSFVQDGLDRFSEEAELALENLEGKIQKLEIFASLATSYASDLRAKHNLATYEKNKAEPSD